MPRLTALLLVVVAACGPQDVAEPPSERLRQAIDASEAPTNLQIVRDGLTSVVFRWTNNNERGPNRHFRIWKSLDDGFESDEVVSGLSSDAEQFEYDNEPNAQLLKWQVCITVDFEPGRGACTPWTGLDPNSPAPPPPPQILSLSRLAGSPRVMVTWNPHGHETFYVRVPSNPKVSVSESPAPSGSMSLLFEYDTPNTYPTENQNIAVQVCGTWQFEPTCTSDSFAVGARPTAAPAVQQLASTASDRVTLVWSHGSTDETGFRVWWKENLDDTFQRIGSTTTELSFTHFGVLPGSTQYYRVCAVSTGGSTCSPTFTAQVPRQLPLLPNGFSVAAVPNQIARIAVSWQPFTQVADPITTIEVIRLNPDNSVGAHLFFPSAVVGFTDAQNVQVDVLYRYYLRGHNAVGAGPYGMAAIRLPIPLPNAPTGLTGVAEDSGNLDLSWTAPAAFPAVSVIRVDRLIAGTFVRAFQGNASITRYHEQSLAPATRYYYRVCAVNMYGERCTTTIGVTTLAAQPGAPVLEKPSIARDSITLTWTPTVSSQLAYRLQAQNGTVWSDVAGAASTATSGTVTGLSANTDYKLRVCAIFSGGTRGCSAALTLRTSL